MAVSGIAGIGSIIRKTDTAERTSRPPSRGLFYIATGWMGRTDRNCWRETGSAVRVADMEILPFRFRPVLSLAILATCLLVAYCTFGGSGVVYSQSCPVSGRIIIKTSVLDQTFELGDIYGYAVFYQPDHAMDSGRELVLYDEDFTPDIPAPYWAGASSDLRDDRFYPLPELKNNDAIRIFSVPTGFYYRSNPINLPPYMNIFLDPSKVSQAEFTRVANCLETNQASINLALSKLGKYYPSYLRASFKPLVLGGIVRGVPPFKDPSYIGLEKHFWHDDKQVIGLPVATGFDLYPGQSMRYSYSGHIAILSYNLDGTSIFTIDGKVINESNVGVGSGICSATNYNSCGKMISYWGQNADGSETFDVAWQNGPNEYSLEPFPSRARSIPKGNDTDIPVPPQPANQ